MISFSVVSFLPVFRIGNVPGSLFLMVPLACWLLFELIIARKNLDKTEWIYILYVLTGIPALLLGILAVGLSSLYVFVYSLVVLLVSLSLTFTKVDLKTVYWVLFVTLALITGLGWVFRLGLLDPSLIFESAESSELLIGYWGIRYSPSTRNADYFYPLLAALLVNLLFRRSLIKNFLTLIFLVTVVLSLSRAGLISSVLIALVLWSKQGAVKGAVNIILPLTLVVAIGFYTEIISANTFETINDIFQSISQGGSKFSNEDRKEIWICTIKEIVRFPFGTGINNFHIPGLKTASAENAFLTIFLERGWIPGLLFFCVLIRLVIIDKFWNSMSGLAMVVTLIYLMFNYELNNLSMSAMFGVILTLRKGDE